MFFLMCIKNKFYFLFKPVIPGSFQPLKVLFRNVDCKNIYNALIQRNRCDFNHHAMLLSRDSVSRQPPVCFYLVIKVHRQLLSVDTIWPWHISSRDARMPLARAKNFFRKILKSLHPGWICAMVKCQPDVDDEP